MSTRGGTAEDTWEMPDTWLRALHPRRDRPGPWRRPRSDASAAETVRDIIDRTAATVENVLAQPDTPPSLTEHGRAYLKGEATPLGAAVVAGIVVNARGLAAFGGTDPFRDAWVTEHGLPFAACAYAQLSLITVGHYYVHSTGGWVGVKDRGPDDHLDVWWAEKDVARHLRALLAAADDDVYDEAVAGLEECRRTPLQKMVVSYLVPTRRDWADEVCSLAPDLPVSCDKRRWMLFCSLGAPDQLARLSPVLDRGELTGGIVPTLVDGIGAAGAVPALTSALDADHLGADRDRAALGFLGNLDCDEAFQALVDRADRPHVTAALGVAAQRFPARALRLLARRAGTPAVAESLRAHVRAHPALVAEMLPGLPEESRTAIEALRDSTAPAPEAPPGTLPPLLTAPPWTRPRTKTKPVVIKDLLPPGLRTIAWKPGERDAWNTEHPHLWTRIERMDWPTRVAEFKKGEPAAEDIAYLFAKGPEDLVRPLLADWEPSVFWAVDVWMPAVVSRFELDALNAVLSVARRRPAEAGALLLPYLADEVAVLMADWLVRLKQVGRTARAWFRRHGPAAVPALLPAALGPSGRERRAAEAALRLIAADHGSAAVVAAARAHDAGAAEAVETFLSAGLLEALPAKTPVLGHWADVRPLPQILLRDRTHALPPASAEHVLTMLALCKPGEPYAGVDVVRELCDPESLAEFGRAVFTRWDAAGAPSKESWALTQLGLTGDDETVRLLASRIRAWPGERGSAKAAAGLDVLASIGTDAALTHLHDIARGVRFESLRTRAQEKIEEVAGALDLTTDQLADRLIPDFGLAADGTLTLDYGPRRFTVGFDERLQPYVTDQDGRRRKTLPKPGAKDDPDLAPAAHTAFAALKKDVRTVAADQIHRLEDRMVMRHRWSAHEFRELLVGHPLVRHLVRRLVWLADDGTTTTAFRVAEDGTFADVHDDDLALTTASVRIAHPVELGDSLASWSEVFDDYEILQPFPQLLRPVRHLTDEDRAGDRLTRFENLTIPVERFLAFTAQGWQHGRSERSNFANWFHRRVTPDYFLVINVDPGVFIAAPNMDPTLTLRMVALTKRPEQIWLGEDPTATFADLDPVTASEILNDLVALS
ncbi:uncharacterized protein DUF4132 [Actinomadura pelletieri DSM 43383]|uniref:Uncharacterized protein DUF4132 n=1 Tax=Actinomadura pelletieri DSM 43383 TaxID=1120940 RepID=A0A495QBS5_9ACTN|nr:DUF4132 domain-containing protein [Actinomadura pelletieri]RKS69142.1 uncharacterized protein DUF4132 [Actinomadura pelletieri DSM 43383]